MKQKNTALLFLGLLIIPYNTAQASYNEKKLGQTYQPQSINTSAKSDSRARSTSTTDITLPEPVAHYLHGKVELKIQHSYSFDTEITFDFEDDHGTHSPAGTNEYQVDAQKIQMMEYVLRQLKQSTEKLSSNVDSLDLAIRKKTNPQNKV